MIDIPDEKLPKEFRKKRVVLFIDGNHLFHRLQDSYGFADIDIEKLCKNMCGIERSLIQIRYYYSPFLPEMDKKNSQKQRHIISKIQKTPIFDLSKGKYIQKGNTGIYTEKGIDVKIAIDMVHLAMDDHYDVAILLSGDSDFVPAINFVRRLHKRVSVAAFPNDENSCHDLIEASYSLINLYHEVPKIAHIKRKG